ncbi:hypothetical protein F5146DRAFT_1130805 [Armillaria mellea]|nr:hypothetical protein F5146DRAFT_1130805 [Armillaria mellea]
MSLSRRVGLVTGGGTGIGFSIAKALAAAGAKCIYHWPKVGRSGESSRIRHRHIRDPLSRSSWTRPTEESVNAAAKHVGGIDWKARHSRE